MTLSLNISTTRVVTVFLVFFSQNNITTTFKTNVL